MPDTKALRAEIEALDHPVFAVLDGAQFDNLPDDLFDGDFVHRPLYLDRGDGDRDQTITAPQLVWLDRDVDTAPEHEDAPALDILDRLFDLIDDKPAAVFWECPKGGDALYKHLRGINMVLIPKEETDISESTNNRLLEHTHDRVLFRHADSNVMAQVIPSLTEVQFHQILGPAIGLHFQPDPAWNNLGGFMTVEKSDAPPNSTVLPIVFSHGNIEHIELQRKRIIKKRMVDQVLLTQENQPTSSKGEISKSFDRAVKYGFTEEKFINDFITADIKFGPQFERRPEFVELLDDLNDVESSEALKWNRMNHTLQEIGVNLKHWNGRNRGEIWD